VRELPYRRPSRRARRHMRVVPLAGEFFRYHLQTRAISGIFRWTARSGDLRPVPCRDPSAASGRASSGRTERSLQVVDDLVRELPQGRSSRSGRSRVSELPQHPGLEIWACGVLARKDDVSADGQARDGCVLSVSSANHRCISGRDRHGGTSEGRRCRVSRVSSGSAQGAARESMPELPRNRHLQSR
jgi:hypothetical protein